VILLFSTCKKEIVSDDDPRAITYKPYGLTYLHDFVVTKSGDLLLLGESTNQIQLTRTKSSGELIWQKNIDLIPEHDVEYTMHNVVENPDQTILVFGTQSKVKYNNNFAVIKLSSSGEHLKTKTLFLKPKDTADVLYYSTNHFGFYTKDQEGGYFIQLRLGVGYSYGTGRIDNIIHLNSKDSFDLVIDPTELNPYTNDTQLELQQNKDNGSLVLLNIGFNGPVDYFIEKLDNAEFLQRKISKKWSTQLPILGRWIRGYSDDRNFYCCNLVANEAENETKGMLIDKLDMNTGAKVKEWLIPFKHEVSDIYALDQPWSFTTDENSLYMSITLENYAYILKTSKDGADYKLIPIGGNISRDRILKIGISGDQILVFGYGSLNRSKEQLLYMCSINKNGEIIDHE